MNGEAGKGDDPRNCFSEKFRNNFDDIDWRKKPKDVPKEPLTNSETCQPNIKPTTP